MSNSTVKNGCKDVKFLRQPVKMSELFCKKDTNQYLRRPETKVFLE
jgi:hypothetical protein